MNKRVLILGVGNVLLGDEGFGVHAMRYLSEHYRWPEGVRLIDGATLGLMLMGELMDCDLVVVLDIATAGNPPGTFYEGDGDALGDSLTLPQSMHQTGIKDVLISCELAGYAPEAILFCMEPYKYQIIQAKLTEEASARLPEFCRRVVVRLREEGIEASPMADSD
ncbi:MAG: hydrogenase maturation protease [Desulfovibrio sp.]|nr:hydrogenase maturation protease [Desulfovibrio sp.]